MVVQPVEMYNIEQGAIVGIAKGVQWREPDTPLYSKVVNTGDATGNISDGHPVGKVIVLNAPDPDRFSVIFRSFRRPCPS